MIAEPDATAINSTDLGLDRLGEAATLVQFSTAFCAPCRAARRVLAATAVKVPGVTHVDIDAESHLELVRRLNVDSTPTTIVLDPAGVERYRATGAPTPEAVLRVLARVIGDASGREDRR